MPLESFYLTTPIFYVNDAPHIGHAYTLLVGDALTRWQRQCGRDVFYLTGTDEHGLKVMRTAAVNGHSPRSWADKLVAESWRPLMDELNIAFSDFIRTTDLRHEECVRRFLIRLKADGYIYEGEYAGLYCVGCEEFKPDSEVIDGGEDYIGQKVCAIHSRPLERLREKNYFFAMSRFRQKLLDYYADNPDFIEPISARNEVVRFVEAGLSDLSISRSSFDWGVKVPWDETHVVYVWFDALLNYLTAIGYGQDPQKFRHFWPAYHLVGKDILRFHAVIWPAMLMAANLPLPKKVYGHGWLLVAGQKMSKSKLTGIAASELTDSFGVDGLRYYFLRSVGLGQDYSFSWEDIALRYQSELANGYGNLASRLLVMFDRYFGGEVFEPKRLEPADQKLLHAARTAAETANAAMGRFAPQDALEAIWDLASRINNYVTVSEPWKLAASKQSQNRLIAVLHTALRGLGTLTLLLSPVMPASAQKLWRSIAGNDPLESKNLITAWQWRPADRVFLLEPLFPRLKSSGVD